MTDRTLALLVCLGAIATLPLSAVAGLAEWSQVGRATVNGCALFAVIAWAWLTVMGRRIARRRRGC